LGFSHHVLGIPTVFLLMVGAFDELRVLTVNVELRCVCGRELRLLQRLLLDLQLLSLLCCFWLETSVPFDLLVSFDPSKNTFIPRCQPPIVDRNVAVHLNDWKALAVAEGARQTHNLTCDGTRDHPTASEP